MNHPADRATVETTGLAWAVRASFRRYLHRIALGAETLDGSAGMLPDMRVYFPVAPDPVLLDEDDVRIDARFRGGVRFTGHGGMIDVRVGDFELCVRNGSGVLRTAHAGQPLDLVGVEVEGRWHDAGIATFRLSSTLLPAAVGLFDDVYPAGTPFDDLEVRLPA